MNFYNLIKEHKLGGLLLSGNFGDHVADLVGWLTDVATLA